MKHPPALIPLLAALLLPPLFAQQSPETNSAENTRSFKQIGISVDYFQLDHGEANRLVRGHTSTRRSDATALHDALTTLVNEEKARRIGGAYLVTRSGQRAKTESIIEHIYPTKFDPPEVSQKLHGPFDDEVDLKTPPTPTAFETRNTGLTLEVDPVLRADGVTVDLNIASEIVEYVGDKHWGQKESRVSQPIFNTMGNSTAISSPGGDWTFIGMHKPSPSMNELKENAPMNPDEQIIVLVRLDVLETDVSADDPSVLISGQAVISTLTEYIEVNASDAARLLAQHLGSGSSNALREELDVLVGLDKAMLLDTASVTTRSGQRAKSTSISEWIYPTKMDSPVIPQELSGPIKRNDAIITPLSYTAFETRNLGTTLEVDPVANAAAGGLGIDINVAPEMVAHLGETRHGRAESQAETPVFTALKTSTAVTVRSNDPLLISVYMPVDKESRKLDPEKRVFLFLTAATLQVE